MIDKMEYLLDRCVMEKAGAEMYQAWYETEKQKWIEATDEIKALKQELRQSKEMHDIVHAELIRTKDALATLQIARGEDEARLELKDKQIAEMKKELANYKAQQGY